MKKMGKENKAKAILFCIMFFLFVLLLLSRWDFPVLGYNIYTHNFSVLSLLFDQTQEAER
jgi:hypothetical protein